MQNEIPKDASVSEFMDLQRYARHEPSILNRYYQVNLLDLLQRMPPFGEKVVPVEPPKHVPLVPYYLRLQGVNKAYHHEVDRINQDTEINQYIITNTLLGRGAYGNVKVCRHKTNKLASYAVKILWLQKIKKKYFMKDKQIEGLINAQIGIMRKVQHKNIIKLEQAIYDSEMQRVFIILQLCKGGSLNNFALENITTDDTLWEFQLSQYFKQAVDALHHLHSLNIIHRDIKPDNLLLTAPSTETHSTLKLIDFGVSELLLQETIKVDRFIGTRNYAAPQLILSNNPTKGKPVDIWALGITLYELFARKHPFEAKNIQELRNCLNQQVQTPNGASEQLADILKKMLKFNPADRITIQQIKEHSWFK